MAVDIQKLFNDEIPAMIAKNQEAAKQIGAKFQFNITGDGGGSWNLNLTGDEGGPTAKPGEGAADCTMTVASEDFQKLHENPQANGMQLFFSGKLKVTGNQMLAMKLSKLFSLGQAS